MNGNDNKTRKQWLGMLFVTSVMNFIPLIAGTISARKSVEPPILILAIFIFAFLILAPITYIPYRCAYRKPGTKLLTFFLIVNSISLVVAVIGMVAGFIGYISGELSLLPGVWLAYEALAIIAAIWWYVLSWKMRKINKKLQMAKAV